MGLFDNFIQWDMLKEFGTLTMIVFMVVEYTKQLPFVKNIKTKYYAGIVAFILISLSAINSGSFAYMDITLYLLSAFAITFASTGLSDFNNPVDKTKKE